ncbi:hypothetical protein M3090_06175, partial [Bacteroides sp. ET71]|nr:hypothetical protein [Bacteroides sp. ET71]
CHVEHCSPPPNGGAKRGLKRSRNISLILFRRVVRSLDCARDDRKMNFKQALTIYRKESTFYTYLISESRIKKEIEKIIVPFLVFLL